MSGSVVDSAHGRSGEAVLVRAGWVFLVAGFFLLAHSYYGIRHDAILYFAQALARLRPDIYLGDIFLQARSQDRYTVFPAVYAWLIDANGLAAANMLLVAASQALFLGASCYFVFRAVPAGNRGFAMLFIAISNGVYGSGLIFKMAEQFATPRPFAESAVLLSAALLVSGRRAGAFAVLVLAALVHPLVALGGFLFAAIFLMLEHRRWLWLLALGIVPLGGALAGVEPFDELLRTLDQEWLDVVLAGSQHVFVSEWNIYDWSLVAWDLSVLLMGMQLAQGTLRRLMLAGLLLSLVAHVASFTGADLLRNVLVTNLQLWRAEWLVHWIALAALPVALGILWKEGSGGRLAAGLVLFGFFLRGLPAGLISVVASVFVFAGRREIALREPFLRALLWALAAGAFFHWYAIALKARDRLSDESLRPGLSYAMEALSKPFALFVLAAAVAALFLRRRQVALAAALAMALFVASVLAWDRRAPIRRFTESAPMGSHPFARIVGPDQEVYWFEDVSAPWVLMQRRSYVSAPQAAGQMFDRDTAMRLRERRMKMNPLEFQEGFCRFMNMGNSRDDACVDDVEAIEEACRDAQDLDFIVLESRRGNAWVAKWTPPVEYAAYRPTYYLYACKQPAGR